MNIHERLRPFQCEHCHYAAASQMTLRRHKLRNHTPRQAWGYQCPHCPEAYMEPASYQQHILARHFGKSATFGCPNEGCQFATKCSKHFREHFAKHLSYTAADRRPVSKMQPATNMARYLIDDEIGSGFTNSSNRERSFADLLAMRRAAAASQQTLKTTTNDNGHSPRMLPDRRYSLQSSKCSEQSKIDADKLNKIELYSADSDWIEAEIIVDGTDGVPDRLPDGQIDLDLD